MKKKFKKFTKFLAVVMALVMVLAMTVAAAPNQNNKEDASSDFEYYSITVNTGDVAYAQGTAGNHTWLVQGTYTYDFSFDGNTLYYRIGNQSGTLSITMPEGYTVADYSFDVTWDDASVNSQESSFDCAIVTISINTMKNEEQEEIPYDPEPEETTWDGTLTINYLDKETGEKIAESFYQEINDITGEESSYMYPQYIGIEIEGYTYDYSKSNNPDSTDSMEMIINPSHPNAVINCYYVKHVEDPEEGVSGDLDNTDDIDTSDSDITTPPDDEEIVEDVDSTAVTAGISPKTGDTTSSAIPIVIVVMAFVVLGLSFAKRKNYIF